MMRYEAIKNIAKKDYELFSSGTALLKFTGLTEGVCCLQLHRSRKKNCPFQRNIKIKLFLYVLSNFQQSIFMWILVRQS